MPPFSSNTSPRVGGFRGTGFVGTAVLAEALLQHKDLHIFAVSPNWCRTQVALG